MLEEKIDLLIIALEQNTNALLDKADSDDGCIQAGKRVDRVAVAAAADKPETAKQKKKHGLQKRKKAAAAKKVDVTIESAKALAKKIALASEDPKECMNQIRETVSETAEMCYEDANIGIDKFDATGLILLQEELTKFVYTSPGEKEEEAAADDLSI